MHDSVQGPCDDRLFVASRHDHGEGQRRGDELFRRPGKIVHVGLVPRVDHHVERVGGLDAEQEGHHHQEAKQERALITPLQIHFVLAVKLTASAAAIPNRFANR